MAVLAAVLQSNFCSFACQRRRDDNKSQICGFQGGGALAERKIGPNAVLFFVEWETSRQ